MQGELSLNVPQQVFTLFYAITWGTAANSQPRWRAFAWGAIFTDTPTLWRVMLSTLILNLFPFVYFVSILWFMSFGGWANLSQWNFNATWKIFLSVIPALAPFGFYRVWIGWAGWFRECFYGVPKNWQLGGPNPEAWRKIGIDLKIESDLNPEFVLGNFLWGLLYIAFGIFVAATIRCVNR